jgi:hypothetical protein
MEKIAKIKNQPRGGRSGSQQKLSKADEKLISEVGAHFDNFFSAATSSRRMNEQAGNIVDELARRGIKTNQKAMRKLITEKNSGTYLSANMFPLSWNDNFHNTLLRIQCIPGIISQKGALYMSQQFV